uniref:Uncharacterized protein n=1 Tax=Manihot esculenta TaxID=3983 RepID=A0A2C9UVT0_MANES
MADCLVEEVYAKLHLSVEEDMLDFLPSMDIDRVLKESPWNYQQIPLLLHELQPHENPRQVEHTRLAMNFTNIWHEYMRVRVYLDVRKPLKRKLQVKKPKGS